MASYKHEELKKKLISLDEFPTLSTEILPWISASNHIKFMQENVLDNELVIYATPVRSLIMSILISEDLLINYSPDDLLYWSGYTNSISCYYERDDYSSVFIEENGSGFNGSEILKQGDNLIYKRNFDGWHDSSRDYFELSQDISHLEELHWMPENSSYCRFDKSGDIEQIVSMTTAIEQEDISLVTINSNVLCNYLSASNKVLLRLFDFTLTNPSERFAGFDGEEKIVATKDELFYKQQVCQSSVAGYARGVQIIRPTDKKSTLMRMRKNLEFGGNDRNHATFIAHDWRNKRISKISTDPLLTTNYFEAAGNDLPLELSPSFFKPEVLSKYKADTQKYTIDDVNRRISCRHLWELRSFDVNEAGQISAYICDLRHLPEQELEHWKQYNEKPKGTISARALCTDFKGECATEEQIEPLVKIKAILSKWSEAGYLWWTIKDQSLMQATTAPFTNSSDEHSGSFLNLTKLVIEGFNTKEIRKYLEKNRIQFGNHEGSIKLLEKIINQYDPHHSIDNGLEEANLLRNKLKGHSSQVTASKLRREAIKNHGTYNKHFQFICASIYEQLLIIGRCFADK
jgi:hypothetical protein